MALTPAQQLDQKKTRAAMEVALGALLYVFRPPAFDGEKRALDDARKFLDEATARHRTDWMP